MPSAAGEAEYVAQLKAYDVAFGKFFGRLAADGHHQGQHPCSSLPRTRTITSSAVRRARPIATAFTCPAATPQIGEITTFLDRLLLTQRNKHDAVRRPLRRRADLLYHRQSRADKYPERAPWSGTSMHCR